ncbi:hypothetical protein [Oryzifoliimicrobium ureilyticus]|uniref:hypothetical protein n=1 Tax=Oryzifoliimicrobium ureilyticus TaxID=3113724 RepID=UPI003075F858
MSTSWGTKLQNGFGLSRLFDRGRDLFDAHYYASNYPDVRSSGMDLYTHFLRFGVRENRAPNAFFSPSFYVSQVGSEIHNPLSHYLRIGAREGLDPHPHFSTNWYLDTFPDVGAAKLNPLYHYLRFGVNEGRPTEPHYRKIFGEYLAASLGYKIPKFNVITSKAPASLPGKIYTKFALPLYLDPIAAGVLMGRFELFSRAGIIHTLKARYAEAANESFVIVFNHCYVRSSNDTFGVSYDEAELYRSERGNVSFLSIYGKANLTFTMER